jgi:hypothetical protein
MARERDAPKVRYWNGWWTLTVITAAATIVVAILEGLGVFRDLGIVLGVIGIVLSIVFGATASTRSAVSAVTSGVTALRSELGVVTSGVSALRDDVGAVTSGITGLGVEFATVASGISAVREELAMVRGEVGGMRGDLGAVREEIGTLRTPLERILQTLVDRLPPPRASRRALTPAQPRV